VIGPPPEPRAGPGNPPCSRLRSFAEAVCATDSPRIVYRDFWRGFPTDDGAAIRTMFRALFGGLGLRKPVLIRSVFSHHHHHRQDGGAPGVDEMIRVSFSGEAEHLHVDAHDLNLIMAPDDPATRVVAYVNFAANAHEADLWPRLAGGRTLDRGKKFCVAVVSNFNGDVRSRFMMRLNQRKKIDSCGAWMNNVGFFPPGNDAQSPDAYFEFLRQYKFMVCFENAKRTHYLTEKLANAYAAGCVPVYWGAPEARQWLNPRAFVCLEDESDAGMDALIDRVLELDRDDAAYAALFAEPLLPDGIPELMRLETMRAKIAATLRRSRPDAFEIGQAAFQS
jgi:hypothetical protein